MGLYPRQQIIDEKWQYNSLSMFFLRKKKYKMLFFYHIMYQKIILCVWNIYIYIYSKLNLPLLYVPNFYQRCDLSRLSLMTYAPKQNWRKNNNKIVCIFIQSILNLSPFMQIQKKLFFMYYNINFYFYTLKMFNILLNIKLFYIFLNIFW